MVTQSPSVSIIVPAYNNSRDLYQCLSALKASAYPNFEVIVVDDASTDETPLLAEKMGARVLRLKKNSGPAAARNYGAQHVEGKVLFFIDADVVIKPGTVGRVVKFFEEHQDVAAVFGSYDTFPQARGVISQYRNLLHHFVHQNGNTEASTFWAGCGAIRRSVFEAIGGFNEKRFPRSSIEDIELGYRLRQAGYRILLDKTLQGTHLKQWTLRSTIRTDILCRAIPWTRLIMESKHVLNDLNLKWGQRLSGFLVVLACFLLPLALIRYELIALSITSLLGVLILNRSLYLFFLRQRGFLFVLACIPLHFLYYFYSVISYLYVLMEFRLRKRVSPSGA